MEAALEVLQKLKAEGDSVQRAEVRIGRIALNKPYVLVGRAEAAGAAGNK